MSELSCNTNFHVPLMISVHFRSKPSSQMISKFDTHTDGSQRKNPFCIWMLGMNCLTFPLPSLLKPNFPFRRDILFSNWLIAGLTSAPPRTNPFEFDNSTICSLVLSSSHTCKFLGSCLFYRTLWFSGVWWFIAASRSHVLLMKWITVMSPLLCSITVTNWEVSQLPCADLTCPLHSDVSRAILLDDVTRSFLSSWVTRWLLWWVCF